MAPYDSSATEKKVERDERSGLNYMCSEERAVPALELTLPNHVPKAVSKT